MSQSDDRTVDQLNEEADIAADYLEGLLDIADYEGDIEMGIRNNRPVVQIVADDDTDIKHLIGRKGEVVDALQQLTRLAVQQKTGERSHLIVDVDGYLKRKRQRLRNMALDAIDEVRETGEPVSLDPMNSFERKIIHDVVREEGMKSRSHGEEPHRYVTVYRKANAAAADADVDPDVEEFDEE
ncbi:KH domain-containing protein [Bifidobacterium sp. SMB2]|uniref:KH domain-containing protein n=1 Tax=Bifidobacterium saimiriisciurei TaxID=2661627 RepID=A0ABX0C964_9BIFI|nr:MULTISPECIES: R3H domain-containing nucleic acid-binding protein [Bifidobacterium]NEG95525.1 KH domain-containing protein [Bifidobacterium sp. SMB2]NEH11683.1 KH domain-containing protein [Bifidobacterium saimiriisciurei]